MIPAPFLGPLFEPTVVPIIATGFSYSQAEIAIHGVLTHNAIDFDVPRGTKILAPADGYYIATYGEELLVGEDGKPRLLSRAQALETNPANKDINPPPGEGEFPLYLGGYTIQGWHGNGRYTQYIHVDWVDPAIPYYPLRQVRNERGEATGDLNNSPMLRANVAEYRKPGVAAFIKAGAVIAEVGMTGCGWGTRCYDFAKLGPGGRPDFRGTDYTYYTEPHLHFNVFGRRSPRTRNATLIDPFGIYGESTAGYPRHPSHWHLKLPHAVHQPLWLP